MYAATYSLRRPEAWCRRHTKCLQCRLEWHLPAPRQHLGQHRGVALSLPPRTRMEIEATEEIIRYFSNEKLTNTVPKLEYDIQELNL